MGIAHLIDMAEAAVRRLLPKDEHIVMAWIGSVVGLVGVSKLTSKKAPEVPVVKAARGASEFGGLEDIPELAEALGVKKAPMVTRVVLTGGPCGGKSSAAKRMEKDLSSSPACSVARPSFTGTLVRAWTRWSSP